MSVCKVDKDDDDADDRPLRRHPRRQLLLAAFLDECDDDDDDRRQETADDALGHVAAVERRLDAVNDEVRQRQCRLTSAERPDAAASMTRLRRQLLMVRRLPAGADVFAAPVDAERQEDSDENASRIGRLRSAPLFEDAQSCRGSGEDDGEGGFRLRAPQERQAGDRVRDDGEKKNADGRQADAVEAEDRMSVKPYQVLGRDAFVVNGEEESRSEAAE